MKEINSKFTLTDFLRNMQVGDDCKIAYTAYKTNAVRSSARRLLKEGIRIKVSEMNMTDGCIVTRCE